MRAAPAISIKEGWSKISVYRTGRIYRHHFSYDHIGTVIQSLWKMICKVSLIKSYVVECKSEEVTYHYEIEYDRSDDVLSIASSNNPADLKLDTSLKASYLLEIITSYHQKEVWLVISNTNKTGLYVFKAVYWPSFLMFKGIRYSQAPINLI